MWATVHCKVCDKAFAVDWEYLEEDGCFLKAGKESPIFCPYCRTEALYAGESVVDDDDEFGCYDDDEEEDYYEDGCIKREAYEEYAEPDCGDEDEPYYF